MSDFVAATERYEQWRAARIPMVAADLEAKHAALESSPFVLLRGTYYRFLEQFPALLPHEAQAPAAVVVGDLHIENFGTWRDGDSRLCWGINDFDEIDVLPYTLDLVRLATSALLAIAADHLTVAPRAACDALLDGWRERIAERRPVPFVFGDRHPHLYRLASEAFDPPRRFARKLAVLPPFTEPLPSAALRMLREVTPWPGFKPTLHVRRAGVGSLGSRRIVAVGELAGGLLVREVKQIPGPASLWAQPGRKRIPRLPGAVAAARGLAADPWRRQSGRWVVRPLAADCVRLELASLRPRHDELAILHSMGAEAANIHLVGDPRAASRKRLGSDERGRPEGWLHAAAETMLALTERDHAAWCSRRS